MLPALFESAMAKIREAATDVTHGTAMHSPAQRGAHAKFRLLSEPETSLSLLLTGWGQGSSWPIRCSIMWLAEDAFSTLTHESPLCLLLSNNLPTLANGNDVGEAANINKKADLLNHEDNMVNRLGSPGIPSHGSAHWAAHICPARGITQAYVKVADT